MSAHESETAVPSSPDHLVVKRKNGVVMLIIPFGLAIAPQNGASFADMWVSTVIQKRGADARTGSITLTASPGMTEEMIDILTERFGAEVMEEIDIVLASAAPQQVAIEVGEEKLRGLASAIALKFDF